MLVLGRHKGQRIMIGSDIVITVTEISSGRVKLGITAPEGITVDREEVFERKKSEVEAGTRRTEDSISTDDLVDPRSTLPIN